MKQIPLPQGKFAIVDDEDFPVLSRFNWFISTSGEIFTTIRSSKLQLEMTRFLMRPLYCHKVSHRDRNKLNNQKNNLIYMTQENFSSWRGRNKTKKLSIYKGVYQKTGRKKKWWASIQKGEKHYFLGYFYTEIEAAEAYNKKALKLFGKFAYQNQI